MEGKWGQERSCGGITRLAWQTFDPYSVYRGVYHRPHPSPKPPLLSSAMCASSHAPRRFLYPTGEEVLFNRRPSFENEWIFVQISEMESTWDRCVQVVLEFQSVVNTGGKFGGRAIEAVGKFLSLVEINRWFNHCLEFAGTKLYCSRADTKELAERKFSVTNVSWAESWFIKN